MIQDKPFIHLIKTPYGHYIFDVNTDTILQTSESVYKYLEIEQNGEEINGCDEKTLEAIKRFKSEGILSSNRPREIKHPYSEVLEYRLNNKLSSIALQVTQSCNLRCSYCVYSDSENNILQRKHSNNKMSYEIAKKGIDFLIQHSNESESVNIGFYGGEPLLELDLVKKCVEYGYKVSEGKKLTFSITTNGTLLDIKTAEFLKLHDFLTTISLDGPKDIHDKNRKFVNNKGSFDSIIKNLNEINQKYPQWIKKVRFNVVVDPANDFSCTDEFFVNYDIISSNNIGYNLISDQFSSEKVYVSESFISKMAYETFKVFLYRLGRMQRIYLSNLVLIRFADFQSKIRRFERTNSLPPQMSHGGPCMPGETRLFMNIYGNLYPCERVSEISIDMKMGDINSGFDYDKARKILNIGKLTEQKCRNCWALKHCTLCASFADDGDGLSVSKKESNCSRVKSNIEQLLKDYIAFKEIKHIYKEDLKSTGGELVAL